MDIEMSTTDASPFAFTSVESEIEGLTVYEIRFSRSVRPDRSTSPTQWSRKGRPRRAFGRAVIVDPKKLELKIYPFYELIHRSFVPGTPHFVRIGPNLGTSIAEFTYAQGGPELRGLGRIDRTRAATVLDELDRCIFACSTLQTGFVRSNGFVVCPQPGAGTSEFVCKPERSLGLDDNEFVPLGPTQRSRAKTSVTFDGQYDIISFAPTLAVTGFNVENHTPTDPLPELALCSPIVLQSGIVKTPEEIPFCPKTLDQTIGNEVNWNPATTCTSFTAFGVNPEKNRIIVVSMFESLRGQTPASNRGITASEMGWLLAADRLEASDGVIGGGSADAQQFLDVTHGAFPTLLEAPPRFKRPDEEGTEVEGARGLGAILAVLQR